MSSQAMYHDEIATAIRIKVITFEAFQRKFPDLSFFSFVQWGREGLIMPDHLHMYYLLCNHYLALARIAQNQDPESGIAWRMLDIFGREEPDASSWWDSSEVSFLCLLLLARFNGVETYHFHIMNNADGSG
jgi:hypothetical protein